MKEFSELLESVVATNVPCFLVGDFNIHVELINVDLDDNQTVYRKNKIKEAKLFMNALNENSMMQMVDVETHDLHGTLDLLLTERDKVSFIHSLRVGFKEEICESDNFPVIFHMKIRLSYKTDKEVIKTRDFSNFDINLYKDELKKCLMSENLEYLDDNNCVELYEASLPSAWIYNVPSLLKQYVKGLISSGLTAISER